MRHSIKLIRSISFLVIYMMIISMSHLYSQATAVSQATDFLKILTKMRDINGKQIAMAYRPDQVVLVLFFKPDSTPHKRTMEYTRIISLKYNSRQIKVITISQGSLERTLDLKKKLRISFPLILDEKMAISKTFNIGDCCGATLLYDKTGQLKFQENTLLQPLSLKQLVEKYVLGQVSPPGTMLDSSEIFATGGLFPRIGLFSLSDQKRYWIDDFKETKLILTFFSSFCGSCEGGKRVETLIRIKRFLEQSKNSNVKVALVFFQPLDGEDIAYWERQFTMPMEKFITEDLFSDEERYQLEAFSKIDPFTIVLDHSLKVLFSQRNGIVEKDIEDMLLKTISR